MSFFFQIQKGFNLLKNATLTKSFCKILYDRVSVVTFKKFLQLQILLCNSVRCGAENSDLWVFKHSNLLIVKLKLLLGVQHLFVILSLLKTVYTNVLH